MATCWKCNTNDATTNCDDCGHPMCQDCLDAMRQGKKDRAQPPKKCKVNGAVVNVYEINEAIPD